MRSGWILGEAPFLGVWGPCLKASSPPWPRLPLHRRPCWARQIDPPLSSAARSEPSGPVAWSGERGQVTLGLDLASALAILPKAESSYY